MRPPRRRRMRPTSAPRAGARPRRRPLRRCRSQRRADDPDGKQQHAECVAKTSPVGGQRCQGGKHDLVDCVHALLHRRIGQGDRAVENAQIGLGEKAADRQRLDVGEEELEKADRRIARAEVPEVSEGFAWNRPAKRRPRDRKAERRREHLLRERGRHEAPHAPPCRARGNTHPAIAEHIAGGLDAGRRLEAAAPAQQCDG